MLLPDTIHPKYSVYYLGALLLKRLQQNGSMSVADLYVTTKKESDMSSSDEIDYAELSKIRTELARYDKRLNVIDRTFASIVFL